MTGSTQAPRDEESGKVLVVYYSATGSTRSVAEYIANAAGGEDYSSPPVPFMREV